MPQTKARGRQRPGWDVEHPDQPLTIEVTAEGHVYLGERKRQLQALLANATEVINAIEAVLRQPDPNP